MGITSYPDLTADQTSAFKTLGRQSLSQFGEQLMVERTSIIELNSSYGISALRDVTSTTGSASIDDINGSVTTGEILLSTGTTASSLALVRSAKTARYAPGFGAEMGHGVRFPSAPTGEQVAEWGGRSPITNNDRIYFGYDATGIYVAIDREGTTETKKYQSGWNMDTLDGSGDENNPSGYELDLSNGVICQIDFTWYGYGQIMWGFIIVVENIQSFIPVHSEAQFGRTSITTPNLEIFTQVENGSTTSNFGFYFGGRHYSVVGKYVPDYRLVGQVRGSESIANGALTPLVSFQRKSAYRNRAVGLASFSVVNSGSNPVEVVIISGGTLTGAGFGTPSWHDASETAVQSDITATGISGGVPVYSGRIVAAAGQGKVTTPFSETLEYELPDDLIVTFCLAGVGGTSTALSGLTIREEW